MHTVIETQTREGGVVVQVAPLVGFCHREAHCEDEESGGRTLWGNNECTQNKGMLNG